MYGEKKFYQEWAICHCLTELIPLRTIHPLCPEVRKPSQKIIVCLKELGEILVVDFCPMRAMPLILHPIKIPSKPLLGENREFFEQRGEVTPTFSLAFIVCHSKKEYNVVFFFPLNGIWKEVNKK